MASFLKPMPRARAEKLLAGVLERTDTYNADDSRSLVITKIAVFGSYLRLATELGDHDLALSNAERRPASASSAALLEHARASRRRFPNLVAQLSWAQTELPLLLCNSSAHINLHTENISRSPTTGASSTCTQRTPPRPGKRHSPAGAPAADRPAATMAGRAIRRSRPPSTRRHSRRRCCPAMSISTRLTYGPQ